MEVISLCMGATLEGRSNPRRGGMLPLTEPRSNIRGKYHQGRQLRPKPASRFQEKWKESKMTPPVPLSRAQEQLATHKRPSRPNSSFLRSNYRFFQERQNRR